MPSGEAFFNLAEIAIVFAGFAGISVVLGRRQGDALSLANAARLSVMIELSVCTALLALLPPVLLGFELEPSSTWRASSAAAFLYGAISAVRGGVLRSRSAVAAPGDVHPPRALALVVLLRAISIVAGLVGALFVTDVPGPLLLSLAANLALAAFLFVGSLWGLRDALGDRQAGS